MNITIPLSLRQMIMAGAMRDRHAPNEGLGDWLGGVLGTVLDDLADGECVQVKTPATKAPAKKKRKGRK